jgi:hypothetical protein
LCKGFQSSEQGGTAGIRRRGRILIAQEASWRRRFSHGCFHVSSPPTLVVVAVGLPLAPASSVLGVLRRRNAAPTLRILDRSSIKKCKEELRIFLVATTCGCAQVRSRASSPAQMSKSQQRHGVALQPRRSRFDYANPAERSRNPVFSWARYSQAPYLLLNGAVASLERPACRRGSRPTSAQSRSQSATRSTSRPRCIRLVEVPERPVRMSPNNRSGQNRAEAAGWRLPQSAPCPLPIEAQSGHQPSDNERGPRPPARCKRPVRGLAVAR